MTVTAVTARKNQMRELVFREIVRTGEGNPGFQAVVEPLGFFTFMKLLDGIVDAVVAALDAAAANRPEGDSL
jgi:hypothetical protein